MIKSIAKALWQNKGNVAMGGIGVYSASDTYQTARESGSGVASAGLQGAADFALPFMMGGWGYAAYEAATELPSLAVEGYQAADNYRRRLGREGMNHAFQNSTFNDTQQVHTMRQAGMAIAQRSRYNIQQAQLGNEAKYMMK
jgi:hypothetical protein